MQNSYKFGKSSSDNFEYLNNRIKTFDNAKYLKKIKNIYSNFENKKNCILCKEKIEIHKKVQNRLIDSFVCENCGHFQVVKDLPDNFPWSLQSVQDTYQDIYPKQTKKDYEKRVSKIYKPKLDFLLEVINKSDELKMISKRSDWYELGCGAGYFLSAVSNEGIKIIGEDSDQYLLNNAREKNKDIQTRLIKGFKELSKKTNSVFCSFFVFEHLDYPHLFWEELSKMEKGTILYFSVPLYGFSVIFDKLCEYHAPRRFDAWQHTQLYTEESLKFIQKKYGFDLLGEWRFGQDFEDLLISANLVVGNSNSKVEKRILSSLRETIDSLQLSLDKSLISDAIHVVWQKN